jgi:hypothetical protein
MVGKTVLDFPYTSEYTGKSGKIPADYVLEQNMQIQTAKDLAILCT